MFCRTFPRFDDEDSCILKPIVTFTISQNTLPADAVSKHSTSLGYCDFPRVFRSSNCTTPLIILEMTKVKLYTSAWCSECMSFGLAAWGEGRKWNGSKSQTFLWQKYSASLQQLLLTGDHIHMQLWQQVASAKSSPEIKVYLELPLIGWHTKKRSCLFLIHVASMPWNPNIYTLMLWRLY